MRRGNVGRVEGEEVDDLDRGILSADGCAHIRSRERRTQTVRGLARGNGAAGGEEEDFLHEGLPFFSFLRAL